MWADRADNYKQHMLYVSVAEPVGGPGCTFKASTSVAFGAASDVNSLQHLLALLC